MDKQQRMEVSLEILPPLNLETILYEKGYSSTEIDSILKNDVIFLSNKKQGSPAMEVITPDTLVLKKLLKSKKEELQVEFAPDKAGHNYLELLSAEIYVGILVFLSPTIWDIAKGFIASWLYDQYTGMKRDSKQLNAKLEVMVKDEKNGKSCHVTYQGPADQVAEVVKNAKFE